MIDLTDLSFQEAEAAMPDFGVLQIPATGTGAIQKINGVGGGFTINCLLPPNRIEPHGRRLLARFQQAKRLGAIVAYPQVDFDVGAPGAPTVAGAHAGGTTLTITAATPRYAVRQGQALNVTKAGRSYLYFAAEQTILDGAGAGAVLLTTPLRTQFSGGEVVNLIRPIIEGWITGDNFGWKYEAIRTVGFSFDLQERA